jgi:hypothetical protein
MSDYLGKRLARYKRSSFFSLIVSGDEIKFCKIDTGCSKSTLESVGPDSVDGWTLAGLASSLVETSVSGLIVIKPFLLSV